jgi:hypothetical protein
MSSRALLAVLLMAAMAACATLPDVPGPETAARDTGYPDLQPLDALLAQATEFRIDDSDRQSLQARAAALQARAAALRRLQP